MIVRPKEIYKDGKWSTHGFLAYDDNYLSHHHFLPTTSILLDNGRLLSIEREEEVKELGLKYRRMPNVFHHGVGEGETKEEAISDLNRRMAIPCPIDAQ
jgi:hypothetical protein